MSSRTKANRPFWISNDQQPDDEARQIVHQHGVIRLKMHDRPDRLARAQQVEDDVNLLPRHILGNDRIDVEVLMQPFVHHTWLLTMAQHGTVRTYAAAYHAPHAGCVDR